VNFHDRDFRPSTFRLLFLQQDALERQTLKNRPRDAVHKNRAIFKLYRAFGHILTVPIQEAQLSQRGHAMLRVIECFAKVTQDHSK